ncbi:MAG: hypothetical protein JWP23_792 [Phenylobacterium sp.]|nr:hypothetical protein [Phenylobacterium sp.]
MHVWRRDRLSRGDGAGFGCGGGSAAAAVCVAFGSEQAAASNRRGAPANRAALRNFIMDL